MTEKILNSEIEPRRISALPTRPTAPTEYGGASMSASELKAAFDRLPELAINRLNSLIDDITTGEASTVMPSGNPTLKTLADVLDGIESGSLASAIKVSGISLLTFLFDLREDVNTLLSERAVTRDE